MHDFPTYLKASNYSVAHEFIQPLASTTLCMQDSLGSGEKHLHLLYPILPKVDFLGFSSGSLYKHVHSQGLGSAHIFLLCENSSYHPFNFLDIN